MDLATYEERLSKLKNKPVNDIHVAYNRALKLAEDLLNELKCLESPAEDYAFFGDEGIK